MLSLQKNFGYTQNAQSQAVSFGSGNAAGNGLIVAGYFACTQPNPNANLSIADSAGNTYTRIGGCGGSGGIEWASLLVIWYVASCKAGANTVTVTQTTPNLTPLVTALAIFEYEGGFSALDVASFATGLRSASLSVTVAITAGDLLFGFAANVGNNPELFLSSSSYTLEQQGSLGLSPDGVLGGTLAADQLVAGPGVQSVTFAFRQIDLGIQTAALVALTSPLAPASGGSSPGGSGSPTSPGSAGSSSLYGVLSLSAIPGFFDLADAAIAAGQPVTDDALLKISHSAKFAAVRSKLIYMGYYAHGNTVPTPIDPDDAYAYSLSECQFLAAVYSNRAPAPGFVAGQKSPPAVSSSQPGPLYNFPSGWDISDAKGLVSCNTTYMQNGNEIMTNDGILKVYAACLRLSLNSSN